MDRQEWRERHGWEEWVMDENVRRSLLSALPSNPSALLRCSSRGRQLASFTLHTTTASHLTHATAFSHLPHPTAAFSHLPHPTAACPPRSSGPWRTTARPCSFSPPRASQYSIRRETTPAPRLSSGIGGAGRLSCRQAVGAASTTKRYAEAVNSGG